MKIAWIDTETTGLNPKENAMIQLSGMLEVNHIIVDEFNFFLRPWNGAIINPDALAVNGRTVDEIASFPSLAEGLACFKKKLAQHVNKFDNQDKFVFAGYNVQFDIGFVRESFLRACDKYYGSWFFNAPIDVLSTVGEAVAFRGLRLPNYKLVTVSEHFKCNLQNAHSADADIRATRELYYKLTGGCECWPNTPYIS